MSVVGSRREATSRTAGHRSPQWQRGHHDEPVTSRPGGRRPVRRSRSSSSTRDCAGTRRTERGAHDPPCGAPVRRRVDRGRAGIRSGRLRHGCHRGSAMTPHAAAFEAVRPRLFGIAYQTLESAADADDVVQDAWIRWQGTDRNRVRDAAAFLATTTKRLALNVAQSARVRRETSVDSRDPEPVDPQADPALGAERREALAFAMRILMEKLSPRERAAYVLREAFDYPYRQIADVLETSEANARQLVRRSRLHLAGEADGPELGTRLGALTDEPNRRVGDLQRRQQRQEPTS